VLNASRLPALTCNSSATSGAWNENAAKAAGAAADGVVFPLAAPRLPGRHRARHENHDGYLQMSDAAGTVYRPVHYIAGVCTALYMKEAVNGPPRNGGATGENVKKASTRNQLGTGRNGGCLQCVDLDREGSPRHAPRSTFIA